MSNTLPYYLWTNIKQEDRDKIRPIFRKLKTDVNFIKEGETEGTLDKAYRELETALKEIGADEMYQYIFGNR
ncbi:MAG: hypothetical protein FWE54_03750 [Methanimicrococcus sp.]|nr:hypothetical protein [Methanimicrococcus sp.]